MSSLFLCCFFFLQYFAWSSSWFSCCCLYFCHWTDLWFYCRCYGFLLWFFCSIIFFFIWPAKESFIDAMPSYLPGNLPKLAKPYFRRYNQTAREPVLPPFIHIHNSAQYFLFFWFEFFVRDFFFLFSFFPKINRRREIHTILWFIAKKRGTHWIFFFFSALRLAVRKSWPGPGKVYILNIKKMTGWKK